MTDQETRRNASVDQAFAQLWDRDVRNGTQVDDKAARELAFRWWGFGRIVEGHSVALYDEKMGLQQAARQFAAVVLHEAGEAGPGDDPSPWDL